MSLFRRMKRPVNVPAADEVARRIAAFVSTRSLLGGTLGGSHALEIRPETRLFSTGLLDSLAFIELVTFIERDLGVSLSDVADVTMDALDRVGDIVRMVSGTPAGEEGGVGPGARPRSAPERASRARSCSQPRHAAASQLESPWSLDAIMAAPVRIGRYDVLGELATGGMATLLLARVVGPSGFERAVVVKRILPHLAQQSAFRHMFVDEARIAAGVRHPNVVQVQELSEADGELFLVMEYLEGESVAGLMKRLTMRGEVLDPELAAYVLAEACAGIHAAHELTDEHGVSRGVVHRDVSPQNVFLTYDGHVKLLDFGVALASDRTARTETGEIKGKFPYMSPEQWHGEPLDRRSDVFALGAVLYELSTGRLLFARPSPAATMRAVCDEPVIPPSRLVDDYPRGLEAACLKALSRARDDRFATALEMRRELVSVARALEKPNALEAGDATERLAAKMRELFADRISQKTKLLRVIRETDPVDVSVPAGEIDQDVALPSVALLATPTPPARTSERASSGSSGAQLRRVNPVLGVAGVLGIALLTAGIATRLRSSPTPEARAEERPASAAISPASESGGVRAEESASESAASPPLPATASASSSAGATAAARPIVVDVRIESRPSGARVKLAGRDAGTTPVDLHLESATAPLPLELSMRGHRTLQRDIVPDRDQRLSLTLARERAAPAPPSRPASSSPRSFGRFE
jgi:serine/threonine-protein kinase